MKLPLRTLSLAFACAIFSACGSDDSPADTGPSTSDAGVAADEGTAVDVGGVDAGTSDATELDAEATDSGRMDAAPWPPNQRAFTWGSTIAATPGEWTWVDVPDARCMNDTPTGFGVNTSSTSDDVIIFMMGGNACFNIGSCFVTANLDGYGRAKFDRDSMQLQLGAFDRAAEENFFKDYNYVFMPYCSGDVFSGANPSATIGSGTYKFQGYENVTQFLERIVPTFPNAERVLLTGVSAGGFGAFFNYDQVARAFGPTVEVTLINDSGPAMGEGFMTGCLQAHFASTWNQQETIPDDCTDCFTSRAGDYAEDYMRFLLTKYGDRNFGLISSAEDETIRTFWGFGLNECRDLVPGVVLPMYPGPMFKDGLVDLRDRVLAEYDNARLYMPDGTRHVWLGDPPWLTEHFGVVLQDWMVDAIEDAPDWAHAPAP